MKIEFKNAKPLTDSQIQSIEKLSGVIFPSEIKHFYQHFAGAKPEINDDVACFKITLDDGYEIESFLENVYDYDSLVEYFENNNGQYDFISEYVQHFDLSPEYVDCTTLLPIVALPNGAVYASVSGIHRGKIYTVDSGDFGIVYHSANLTQFLDIYYRCD